VAALDKAGVGELDAGIERDEIAHLDAEGARLIG